MSFYVKIFVLLFGVFAVKSDIHLEMSPNEIHQIFRRSDGSVPEYVVMRVDMKSGIRQKRDITASMLKNVEVNDLGTNQSDSKHVTVIGDSIETKRPERGGVLSNTLTPKTVEVGDLTVNTIQSNHVEPNAARPNFVQSNNPENTEPRPNDLEPSSTRMPNTVEQPTVRPNDVEKNGAEPNSVGTNGARPSSVGTNGVTSKKLVPVSVIESYGLKPRVTGSTLEGLHFETTLFGNDIDLWLNSPDSFLITDKTPIYRAAFSALEPQNVKFTRKYGLMDNFSKLYENPETFSSLVIGQDESDKTTINGNIGAHNIAIRSLPNNIVDRYTRNRRSTDKLYDLSGNYSYHVAYKMDEAPGRDEETSRFSRSATIDDDFPKYLYPEVLVVVDYATYQYNEETNVQSGFNDFLKYLVAFWHGVDLKMRSMKGPSIRLHISGIVLSEDPRATPYISENMITLTEFNSNLAITNASTFFYGARDTFPIESYDIIAIMTRFTMKAGTVSTYHDVGASVMRGACLVNHVKKFVGSIAVFNDNGVFNGIHHAAHELGHVIGSGDELGTVNCHSSLGFIMASPSVFTLNSSDYSPCSRRLFHFRLQRHQLKCLYNNPRARVLPNFMPGRVKDLKAQCNVLGYGEPCEVDARVCLNIRCLDATGVCINAKLPALDGTKCHNSLDMFCLHMQCVTLSRASPQI